jgi:hypothetical protein
MANIFLGVVPVATGSIPGTVPTHPERLTDGSVGPDVTSVPLQVVLGPDTFHGYWTMDLGALGNVRQVQLDRFSGGGASLESSTDGVSWDTVISVADFDASMPSGIVSASANNLNRRFWRLHYAEFEPGLGSIGGTDIYELSVLDGELATPPVPASYTGRPSHVSIDKSLRLVADTAEVTFPNEALPYGWGPTTPYETNTRIRIYQWYGDD